MSEIGDAAMEALTRSFLLGTARHPAPVAAWQGLVTSGSPPSELTALALLGQRLRYRRHGPPPDAVAPAPVEDARKIVPEAARALMRQLVDFRNGDPSDIAALALADACHRRRLRPHPFDLPRLRTFTKRHGELLGSYASAWAARGEEGEKTNSRYFDVDTLDESNWTAARPAARVAFIAAMRAREPERARILVEASFASDPAPTRARLLDALVRGISPADVPFLEALAKDRAPSVRERAERLLKYIPGTASTDGRLRDLVDRTKTSAGGLLRRRKKLSLELPATLQEAPAALADDRARHWAAEQYVGIGLDAIAAAFALLIEEMVAAAADDVQLLALFARQASIEGRLDVLAAIVREHAADAWIDAIGPVDAAGGMAQWQDDAALEAWCHAALAPELWPALPSAPHLDGLYTFLRRPLPPAQGRELLRSRAFAAMASADPLPAMVGQLCVAVAALTPAPLRSELRATLAALASEEPLRAVLLLDCLALLDPSTP